MRLNNRGEAITIAVAGVAIVCVALGLLFRPIMDKVLPIFSNNQKIVSTKTVESKPVWIKNPDGSSTLVQTTSTVEDSSNAPVKLTFMQRVQSLGGLGILLVVLGVIFPPFGAILAIIWSRISKAAKAALSAAHDKIDEIQASKDEFTGEAKLIVQSVDDGLATMDANIKAAKTMADSTTDPAVKTAYNTITAALLDMKTDFMNAMSMRQDSTTKKLVSALKND